jgi:hypothetical protein
MIEIEIEPVWKNGPAWRINRIGGVLDDKTVAKEDEYIQGVPFMFYWPVDKCADWIIGRDSEDNHASIRVRGEYSTHDLNNIIQWMKACGERRHEINHRRKDKHLSRGRRGDQDMTPDEPKKCPILPFRTDKMGLEWPRNCIRERCRWWWKCREPEPEPFTVSVSGVICENEAETQWIPVPAKRLITDGR